MQPSVSLVRYASRLYQAKMSKRFPALTRRSLASIIRYQRKQTGGRGIRAIKLSHVGYPTGSKSKR